MTKYLLGIDGGGSKTDFLLCDLELNEIGRLIAPRSNPNDIGIDRLESLLTEGINSLLCKCGVEKEEILSAFAGIAGLTSADYSVRVKNLLSEMLPNAKCDALHDGINVLYGAFPKSDGVSIICGTGSSCFVKIGNTIFRIGGYGSFDLVGNGYEIGKSAIAHSLRVFDGRAEKSILSQSVTARYGEDLVASLDKLLAMTKDELAALAPVVFDAASQGDSAALAIIRANMEYIAELINKAGDYFESEYRVALAGGILKNEIAFDMLSSLVDSRAILVTSDRAPSFGAAAKAYSLID